MVNIVKILKHNICFTPFKEHVTYYINIRNFSISIVYKSNTIYDIKSLGIRDVNDLVNKIEPFSYYLASKYQKRKENNYEAFLA